VTPNAVDAYVHYLRTKLGDVGHRIETVRGVGYRLGDA
jgi:DNA-binding response OmpR family regulator